MQLRRYEKLNCNCICGSGPGAPAGKKCCSKRNRTWIASGENGPGCGQETPPVSKQVWGEGLRSRWGHTHDTTFLRVWPSPHSKHRWGEGLGSRWEQSADTGVTGPGRLYGAALECRPAFQLTIRALWPAWPSPHLEN